jgi:hypothetical protein
MLSSESNTQDDTTRLPSKRSSDKTRATGGASAPGKRQVQKFTDDEQDAILQAGGMEVRTVPTKFVPLGKEILTERQLLILYITTNAK